MGVCLGLLSALGEGKAVLELPPSPQNPRNSEGDFVRLKDGTLLFAWSRFSEGYDADWDNGFADIAARRSSDGGRTWTSKDEILVKNTAANIMSVSFLRLADGRIALFYLEKLDRLTKAERSRKRSRVLVRTSSDEAVSWSEPTDLCAAMPHGYYTVNNARVIQLKGGRILVPVSFFDSRPASRIGCVLSDDAGKSWRSGDLAAVFDGKGDRVITQEPGVVELSDGRVMLWARTTAGSQFAACSSDGGQTWGSFGPTDLVGPLAPATIKRLRTGELIAVWNDYREKPRTDARRTPLSLALSPDDGRTWSPSLSLEDDPMGSFCYTAFCESGDDLFFAYCKRTVRNLDTIRVICLPRNVLRVRRNEHPKGR